MFVKKKFILRFIHVNKFLESKMKTATKHAWSMNPTAYVIFFFQLAGKLITYYAHVLKANSEAQVHYQVTTPQPHKSSPEQTPTLITSIQSTHESGADALALYYAPACSIFM